MPFHGKPWELYDLEADRTELNDLAARMPERAKKLAAQWERWAKRTNVLPDTGFAPACRGAAGGPGAAGTAPSPVGGEKSAWFRNPAVRVTPGGGRLCVSQRNATYSAVESSGLTP